MTWRPRASRSRWRWYRLKINREARDEQHGDEKSIQHSSRASREKLRSCFSDISFFWVADFSPSSTSIHVWHVMLQIHDLFIHQLDFINQVTFRSSFSFLISLHGFLHHIENNISLCDCCFRLPSTVTNNIVQFTAANKIMVGWGSVINASSTHVTKRKIEAFRVQSKLQVPPQNENPNQLLSQFIRLLVIAIFISILIFAFEPTTIESSAKRLFKAFSGFLSVSPPPRPIYDDLIKTARLLAAGGSAARQSPILFNK